MPLNPSVFGNMLNAPKSPEEYAAERENLLASRQANVLNRQKMDEYSKGIERQNQLRNLLAGGANADVLRKSGFLDEASAWDKNNAAVSKDRAVADEHSFNLAQKRYDTYRKAAASRYNDPNLSKQSVLGDIEQMKGMGVLTPELADRLASQLPEDPMELRKVVKAAAMSQLNGEQLLTAFGPKPEKFDSGGQIITRDMNPNSPTYGQNTGGAPIVKVQSPESRASVAATIRGQDKAAEAAAASRRQADEHFKATQAAGGKSGAATEDERKAAGWLSQADNAWKNMQAAMGGVDPKTGRFKNEDVARPGFADAITAIPSFGLGEVVGNTLRSPERQKFNQAASSLSEAILRAATGAGVNKDEALQKIRELTPVFGEDSATTKQKMDSIPMYLNALKQRAGRAIPQGQGGDFGGGWKIEKVN